MKNSVILLSLAVCLIFSVTAQGEGFIEGDNYFNLAGTGGSSDGFDDSAFATEFAFGKFLSDSLAGEIRQGFSYIDPETGGSDWAGSTRVALDYYFGGATVWPFIGANLGYQYGDGVTDSFIGGPEAGVKVFVNDTTYLFGMIEYQIELDNVTTSGYVYSLGVGFRF